ncbi:MAG TPA: methyl-accepting chemotaxis protein [Fimbriimonadaceae bacterium]|nr:methyl-accepting chemotaxis protein [Fimbriimonadaceae bacterium]
MKTFRNLPLAVKLAIGFGCCVLMLLAVCGVSLVGMGRMNASTSEITSPSGPMKGVQLVAEMRANFLRARQRNSRMLSNGKLDYEKGIAEANKFTAAFQEAMSRYEKQAASSEDQQTVAKLKQVVTHYDTGIESIRRLFVDGKSKQAAALFYDGEVFRDFTALMDTLDKLMDLNANDGERLSKLSAAEYGASSKKLLAIGAVAVLLAIVFAVGITRQITHAVAELSEKLLLVESNCLTQLGQGLTAIAEGDLTLEAQATTTPIAVNSKDELGKLAVTFNSLLAKTQQAISDYGKCRSSLTQLLRQVKGASAQVSTASNTLAATAAEVEAAAGEVSASMQQIALATQQAARGASEVATGTTNQAKSLATSSQGVQTLAEAIQGVARDAASASEAANTAGEAATRGTTVVEQSMKGMKAISGTVSQSAKVIHTLGESSQKIGAIVQTISEIAEQTNLLALNAAIEAARAGDAGRGFAVVADEVRKLAERSGRATEEIGTLIGEIQSQTSAAVTAMEAGTKEVEAQGEVASLTQAAFDEIQTVFKSVLAGVEDIRGATAEMSAASEEVARSITEVVSVVEESSAAAEELSASSEEVSASVDTVASAAGQQSASAQALVSSSQELQALSKTLSEAVAAFKMDDHAGRNDGPSPMLRAA